MDPNAFRRCVDSVQRLRRCLQLRRVVFARMAKSPNGLERTAVQKVAISLLVITSLLTGFDARADLLAIAWDGNDRFERSIEIRPGKFAEICGPLQRGQAIAWSFEADRPVQFNIHYHDGPKVVFPEKREARKNGLGTLAVEADQDFCWMWANRSDGPVALRLSLKR